MRVSLLRASLGALIIRDIVKHVVSVALKNA